MRAMDIISLRSSFIVQRSRLSLGKQPNNNIETAFARKPTEYQRATFNMQGSIAERVHSVIRVVVCFSKVRKWAEEKVRRSKNIKLGSRLMPREYMGAQGDTILLSQSGSGNLRTSRLLSVEKCGRERSTPQESQTGHSTSCSQHKRCYVL